MNQPQPKRPTRSSLERLGLGLRKRRIQDVRVAWGTIEPHTEGLHPDELRMVSRYKGSRRYQKAAGRRLARQALAGWSDPEIPLLMHPTGDPIWPRGIVGSISHTKDGCVVLVAREKTCPGIGVDLEEEKRLTEAVGQRIMTPEEIRWLTKKTVAERQRWQAFFFSAKEAVFKCLFPKIKRRLRFQEVTLLPDWKGRFKLVDEEPGASIVPEGMRLEGYYAFAEGLVLTVALLRVKEMNRRDDDCLAPTEVRDENSTRFSDGIAG